MRIYRNIVWSCIWICVISLFIILMVRFFPIIPTPDVFFSYVQQINESIYDFSLGIFASAFVVLLTTLGSYYIDKKRNIGLLKHYCNAYVLKLCELISLLQEADDTGKYLFDINKIKDKIVSENIHLYVEMLLNIYNERLINVEFYPICRKNNENLEIQKLSIAFCRINDAIRYFDTMYKIKKFNVYKAEKEGYLFNFTDDEFIKYVDIVMQSHKNDEYKKFLVLLQKLIQKTNSITAYTAGCEDKCL